ncbi:hypothetical protein A0H81_10628 [Grifola frondosa]|uniref:Uncharacterized protein n=1 Tax=Grifola frondosa TaxID=5627 RepID=A0A1C7LY64_GRIFR|nr:hypothetical protein A0H81_10628 [Grifola frondosa]
MGKYEQQARRHVPDTSRCHRCYSQAKFTLPSSTCTAQSPRYPCCTSATSWPSTRRHTGHFREDATERARRLRTRDTPPLTTARIEYGLPHLLAADYKPTRRPPTAFATAAGDEAPEFTALQLLRVMNRQPGTRSLPYFLLCREMGARVVDGMVTGRIIDLQWTERRRVRTRVRMRASVVCVCGRAFGADCCREQRDDGGKRAGRLVRI